MSLNLFAKKTKTQTGIDINPEGINFVILEKKNSKTLIKNCGFEALGKKL